MWSTICEQLAKRFLPQVTVFDGRVYDRDSLGERLPVLTLRDESTLAAAETSHLMALPVEVLELILRYAIANSVVEVRTVKNHLLESAVRMIDYPTCDAVKAGGVMPSTAYSLLRVNKAISRVLVTLFDLPDTLFCRNPRTMLRLILDLQKRYTHIHIRRIISEAQALKSIDDWKYYANMEMKATGAMAIFILKNEA